MLGLTLISHSMTPGRYLGILCNHSPLLLPWFLPNLSVKLLCVLCLWRDPLRWPDRRCLLSAMLAIASIKSHCGKLLVNYLSFLILRWVVLSTHYLVRVFRDHGWRLLTCLIQLTPCKLLRLDVALGDYLFFCLLRYLWLLVLDFGLLPGNELVLLTLHVEDVWGAAWWEAFAFDFWTEE